MGQTGQVFGPKTSGAAREKIVDIASPLSKPSPVPLADGQSVSKSFLEEPAECGSSNLPR
jgi:hypothetical protein